MRHASLHLALATVILLGSLPAAALSGGPAEYPPTGDVTYAVFRDGDQIGTQLMDFTRSGNHYDVVTRINIAVTILGVTFFRFVTDSDELWIDGKFASFVAKTNDNGTRHDLSIRPAGQSLEIDDNGTNKMVAGNLLLATLWNPASLTATQLIDPVDGIPKKVEIFDRGLEKITVRGQPMLARHESFTGPIQREVWYGPDDRIVYMEYRGPDGSLVTTRLR